MADRDAMLEDAKKALNTPSGLVKLPALDVLEVLAREHRLAKALHLIALGEHPHYPARHSAESWAEAVLVDPLIVDGVHNGGGPDA